MQSTAPKPYDAALAVLADGNRMSPTRLRVATYAALQAAGERRGDPTRYDSVDVDVSTRAVGYLGRTRFVNHTPVAITMSLAHAALSSPEAVADTIAHEVAHVVAGWHAAHGALWRQAARECGAEPLACASDVDLTALYRVIYYCPDCEGVIGRQKGLPKRPRSCRACSSRVIAVDVTKRRILAHISPASIPAAQVASLKAAVAEAADAYDEAKRTVRTLARRA